jgi:hypothetical protein
MTPAATQTRIVFPARDLRGTKYEVWTDGTRIGSGFNWWIVRPGMGPPQRKVMTPDAFDPPLTAAEVMEIDDDVRSVLDR